MAVRAVVMFYSSLYIEMNSTWKQEREKGNSSHGCLTFSKAVSQKVHEQKNTPPEEVPSDEIHQKKIKNNF